MSQYVPLGVLLAACDEAEMHHDGELTSLQLRLLCTLHAVTADAIGFEAWVNQRQQSTNRRNEKESLTCPTR